MNRLIKIVLIGLAVSQLHGCATAVVGAAATGTAVALDRRTAGVVVSDQEIEFRSMTRMSDALAKNASHISSTSYNRQLLLTGQVPDDDTRNRATDVAKQIPDVRAVFNELNIAGGASFTSKASDAAITSSVKARLFRNESVPGTKIKVVTESGAVYLMGLVTQAEASTATEIARTTSGVTKVITLFEFIN